MLMIVGTPVFYMQQQETRPRVRATAAMRVVRRMNIAVMLGRIASLAIKKVGTDDHSDHVI